MDEKNEQILAWLVPDKGSVTQHELLNDRTKISTKANVTLQTRRWMNGTCVPERQPDLQQAISDFKRSDVLSAAVFLAINLDQTS